MSKVNKRFLAGTASVAMLASVVAPISTFAATGFTDVPDGSWAEDAINYGVEQGYIHGQSDSIFGYGQEIKRQDAAVIIASAIYGDSSLVPSGVPSFTDVSSSSYAAKYIAALEEYGIVGDGKGHFSPADTITRAEFAQMIVQAFELKDNGEDAPSFTDVLDGAWYDNAITVLATQYGSVGYPDGTWRPNAELTREAAAQFIYGVHSVLNTVGDIAIKSVEVVDVNKIEVKFNQPVDTELANVKLMKGQANYNVTPEWNEAGNTVVLTSATKITPDTYKVVVEGLTDNALESSVTVTEEAATSLAVSTTQVEISSSAAVYFNVYNQYGTPFTGVDASNFTVVVNESINDVTFGNVVVNKSTDARGNLVATFPITDSNSKLVAGDKFKVTAVYGGFTVDANVTFVEPANLTSLTFGTVEPLADEERITVGDADLVVPYTALDQYGNDYDLTLEEGITFVSSDKDVVDVSSLAVNSNGELTVDAGEEAGTAIITAILPDGETSQFKVTVDEAAEVSSVVITAPTSLVADGEVVSLNLVVKDQYGEVIPSTEVSGLTFSHDFAINPKTGKLEGIVTEDSDFEVTASKDGEELSSVTFTVEAKAFANKITSIDFATLYEVGATGVLTTDNLVVEDQYGRDFTPSSVSLTAKDTTNSSFSNAGTTISADEVGENVYTVVVDGSASTEITVKAVASSSITSYDLAPLGTLYNGEGYSVTPELVGKTADGTTVVLKDDKIASLTSSDNSVAITSGAAIVGAGDAFTSTNDKTVTIKAWDTVGNELGSTELVVTNKAPKLTIIIASSEESETVADIFDAEDQYGVEFAEKGTWYFTSTTTSETVSVSDETQTLATTDTGFGVENGEYTVKFVSTDGNTVASTVITVK